jgi:hypothetical protein
VPLAFYLNPGITLPDDLPAVKAQIREHGYRLVIFDSLYNFGAPGLDWSKTPAPSSAIYTALKRLCDDIEGLTIVLVDHASKPSDSNKGRDDSISSFGSDLESRRRPLLDRRHEDRQRALRLSDRQQRQGLPPHARVLQPGAARADRPRHRTRPRTRDHDRGSSSSTTSPATPAEHEQDPVRGQGPQLRHRRRARPPRREAT